MKNYNLFLDDIREPKDVTWVDLPKEVEWVIVKSFDEFVDTIFKRGIPKLVSYDCDLCDEHYQAYFMLRHSYVRNYHTFTTKCGIHCIEHLLEQCESLGIKHPESIIHTRNHYSEGFMKDLIERHNEKYLAK